MSEPQITQEKQEEFIQFIVDRLKEANYKLIIQSNPNIPETWRDPTEHREVILILDKEKFAIHTLTKHAMKIKNSFIRKVQQWTSEKDAPEVIPVFWEKRFEYRDFFPNDIFETDEKGKFINNDDIPLIKEAIKKYNNEKKSKGGRKHKSRRRRKSKKSRRKSKKSRKSRRRRRKTRRRRR